MHSPVLQNYLFFRNFAAKNEMMKIRIMKKFGFMLAAFCCFLGLSTVVSCSKDDGEETSELQRVLYSELGLPDDGSNSSKYGISDEDIETRAKGMGVEAAALKAVWKVDTGGHGGFLANGDPMILFQGHIFWQQLRTRGLNPQNYVKGNEDILHQRMDKSKFVGGVGEWERLERAVAIHEDAALSSASWGMFQIMGFNYGKCGCKSVQEFVSKMKESEVAQLDLFVAFLKSNSKMVEALKNRSWVDFARLYYGPTEYNIYAEKLSKAYAALK